MLTYMVETILPITDITNSCCKIIFFEYAMQILLLLIGKLKYAFIIQIDT